MRDLSRAFVPKNRAATEHRGQVSRERRYGENGEYAVLTLADGATVVGETDTGEFASGTTYRFLGKWEDDPNFGPRFRFSTFTIHAVHNKVGVVKYLTSFCEGIGVKLAERIYERFRYESVVALRERPLEVAMTCGIDRSVCETAAEQLAYLARFEDVRLDLFGLFNARGFQGKLIDLAIDKWKERAPAVIRKNPFVLIDMPSAGFKRLDKLWCDLGLPKDALKRLAILAAHELKNDRHGNTWVSAHELGDKLMEKAPGCDPFKALKLAIRARKIKKYEEPHSSVKWLANYRRGTSEERIAAALERLSKGPALWPTDRVPVSQEDGDRLPSAHQVERLKLATAGAVGLFLGGPGTGKTHTLAYLLREVIAEHGREAIVVCAPTGKAAVRATQALRLAKLDLSAATIHSTLGIGRNGHDGEGWGFEHNARNPLDCKFVVCDETSMNDADLTADLLDALPNGCQVLFVGDPHQLPPVGHGAPLRDMIDGRVPHGELSEVRRNAGLIVRACQQIKDGKPFDTCDVIDLGADEPRNLKLLDAKDDARAREVLVETLKGLKAATGFDPVWQTQVIVARNTKGEICRKKLNELLQPLANPNGFKVKGNPFAVGDKVICTKNGWLRVVELRGDGEPGDSADPHARAAKSYEPVHDDEGNPVEAYVANGEIGRVVAVGPKLTIARFSEGNALVKILMGKQREEEEDEIAGEDEGGGKGCNFDHAYAITCHKCQGSESPCIIVMGDEQAISLTTREWIYTAISRASRLCLLVGKRATFDKMASRPTLKRRRTFLKQRILENRYADL
ncbi:AAA family ATPase [Gemmata sp. JC717]|uniref:AAA family ATPase n=1 Tax=Gemmata algarum TaxID=2975278 RepID=UPI0021BB4485|nr:AAA family ATPase [Gemmata algarum]MDY3555322.1 AAA family ATPase [Gemmata algarum]